LSVWPYALIAIAGVYLVGSRGRDRVSQQVLSPTAVAALMLAAWQIVCQHGIIGPDNPTPGQAGSAFLQVALSDWLWKDASASLFRVTWGYLLAGAVAIPLGLWVGWSTRTFQALNPIIQGLRPISPIAWIPFAILWYGIGDGAGIFLIFYASFFPIAVGTMAAVRNISLVHQRSAQNFGLRGVELFRRVVFPAAMPQIITALRIALGVAWLVIVAAEMVGMDSGLGYRINDARNMGKRYDLIAATMLVIGAIGIVLDLLIRRLERFDEVRWGYVER
jgi:NitT/TauT family transport system permease protein